ncbi:MAG TPA: hypothetical protein VGM06_09305 [Polyangiaceae bacterium]|jgi:hypothetical protein
MMQERSSGIRGLAGAAVIAAVAVAGVAHAQTPEDPPPPVPVASAPPPGRLAAVATGSSWYGYELLMADAFTAMSFAGAAAAGNGAAGGALAALGGAVYVGSGAAIHVMHHQGGKAVASVVLRVGAPFLGGLIGLLVGQSNARQVTPLDSATSSNTSTLPAIFDAIVGFGVGVVSAVVVDDVFLSFERSPGQEAPPPAPPAPNAAFSVTPYAGAVPGARGEAQAALGLTGRF